MTQMTRERARELGLETVRILEAGSYAAHGRVVDVAAAAARSVTRTVELEPQDAVPAPVARGHATIFRVMNRPTLTVARAIAGEGRTVAALNFASPTSPGGGFLEGALAQEESIARSSALFACLRDRRMYDHHRRLADPVATAWAIYSPDVPVFRTHEGELLDAPFACSVLTCAAPDVRHYVVDDPERARAALRERVDRVLSIAAAHPHDVWILGAWGAGAFGNSAEDVAALFDEGLRGSHANVFAEVVFAVMDGSDERRFIGPFERRFGPAEP